MSGLHDFATHVMHSCKNIEWLTLTKETSISRAICQKLSESNNSLFTPSLNICVNYVEEPFIYQLHTVLALPFSLFISVKERMKTGLKLPSRASVVTLFFYPFVNMEQMVEINLLSMNLLPPYSKPDDRDSRFF